MKVDNKTRDREYLKEKEEKRYNKTLSITKEKYRELRASSAEREESVWHAERRKQCTTFSLVLSRETSNAKDPLLAVLISSVLLSEMQRGGKVVRPVAKGELTNGKDLSGATAGARAFFIGEKRAARSLR